MARCAHGAEDDNGGRRWVLHQAFSDKRSGFGNKIWVSESLKKINLKHLQQWLGSCR